MGILEKEIEIDVHGDFGDDMITRKDNFASYGIDNRIAITSIVGEYGEESLDLEFTLSDGKAYTEESFFEIGPGVPMPNRKNRDHCTFKATNSVTKFDVNPEYYLDMLSNWGDTTFMVFITKLFYPKSELYFYGKPLNVEFDYDKVKECT